MKATIGARLIKALEPAEKEYVVRDTEAPGFVIRVYPSGMMNYYCQYGRGRALLIAKVGQITPQQARDRAREILADHVKGRDPMAQKRLSRAKTFREYVENVYQPWAESHLRSAGDTVRKLRLWFEDIGDRKLHEISTWLVEKRRGQRRKAGSTVATVNRETAVLRASLNLAVRLGLLKENRMAGVRQFREDSNVKPRFLTDAEEARLRTALQARDERRRQERESANAWRQERDYPLLPAYGAFTDHVAPMVRLALATGLRRGELFNLRWGDVDLQAGMLTVQGAGAKSGKTRHVPLNAEGLEVLRQWRACSPESELAFPGPDGRRLDNIATAWRNLVKQAKVSGFRFHDCRHHFGSRLVQSGVDLATVRALLGHSDFKLTLRYAHLAPANLREAVNRLMTRQPAGEAVSEAAR